MEPLRSAGSRDELPSWKKDSDPAVPSDASWLFVILSKVAFRAMSLVPRWIAPLLFPPPLTDVNFYDVSQHPGVRGLCSLTVDDCFCRQEDESKSLMAEFRELFAEARANPKATFFTTLVYGRGPWREREVEKYLEAGHELANHGKYDKEYQSMPVEEFTADLEETSGWLQGVSGLPTHPSWFRAPSGRISAGMSGVLKERGMKHVMLDSYANDPHIPDAAFIASNMVRAATHGSILIIHMPERGFREWNLEATRLLLEGLADKGLRSVTLTDLEAAALNRAA